jgi:hypothetical protein
MWSGLASTIEIIEYFLSSVSCISEVLHFINLDISFIWHAFIHRYCDILEQTSAAGPPEGIYAKDSFRIHSSFKRADHNIRIYEPLLHAVEQAQSTTFHQHRTPELMEKCA